MLLSIGDRVQPGSYERHSRFERACNFTCGPRLVCVVDESVGAGPLNIVLAEFHELSPSSLWVGNDCVIVGGCRVAFSEGQRYRSALRIGDCDLHRFRRNLSRFGNYLTQVAPAGSLAFLIDESRTAKLAPGFARRFANEMARSAGEFFRGDLFAGIAGLKGCGPGLTPSGDDFLAGVLIGLHVVQQICTRNFGEIRDAIFAAALGGNLFSNNFLKIAHSGLVSEHVQTLITALFEGGGDKVLAATRKLMALGGTSGADFATGLYIILRDRGEFVLRCEKRSAAAFRPTLDNAEVGPCS